MKEERKIKRRHLILYLRVFDSKSDELLGNLGDLTTEGIMVVSDKQIEINKSYNLKMTLPAKIEGQQQINLHAKAVWCNQDVNSDYYDTGFKINDIDPQTVHLISKIISDLGFSDTL